jgi:hypothetical protein
MKPRKRRSRPSKSRRSSRRSRPAPRHGNAARKKTFQERLAAYPTYDPEVEGYGNPQDWNAAFFERMGFEEAQRVVSKQNKTSRQILGLGPRATWPDVVKAYRTKMLANHPDRIASTGMSYDEAVAVTKEINAAFSLLAREFGK